MSKKFHYEFTKSVTMMNIKVLFLLTKTYILWHKLKSCLGFNCFTECVT